MRNDTTLFNILGREFVIPNTGSEAWMQDEFGNSGPCPRSKRLKAREARRWKKIHRKQGRH
jgi:hypothetical protein